MGIFHSQWWLNAVAPGKWQEVVVADRGRVRARWPYVLERRAGFTRLIGPPLTPRLGPWIDFVSTNPRTRIDEQRELLPALADQLPRHDQFLQSFHPQIDYWLPLSWRGFTQTAYYSYTLEDLSDLNAVWCGFNQGTRRNIKKAQKSHTIRTDSGSSRLYDVTNTTLRRGGASLPFGREVLDRAYDECIAQNQGKVFSAHNGSGELVAALFLVWDEQTAYYLLGGAEEDARGAGVQSLIMWEAIQFSATVTRQFDFEGSRIASIEHYFRGFGGRPIPYSQVERRSSPAQILLTARDLGRRRRSGRHDSPAPAPR